MIPHRLTYVHTYNISVAHGMWHDAWLTVSRLVGEVWPISRSAAAAVRAARTH